MMKKIRSAFALLLVLGMCILLPAEVFARAGTNTAMLFNTEEAAAVSEETPPDAEPSSLADSTPGLAGSSPESSGDTPPEAAPPLEASGAGIDDSAAAGASPEEGAGGDEEDFSPLFTPGLEWQAEDFLYSEVTVSLYTHANKEIVNVSGFVVAGFSESGFEKAADNKHLVVPARMPDGTAVVGVGKNAFESQGLTGITLPQGTTNFIIQDKAFYNNALTELFIPSGIIQVGVQAFYMNQLQRVVIADTLFYIGNQSFARNQISEVIFPLHSITPVQMDNYSFAYNSLTAVQLSDNIEKISGYAFLMNPGNNEKSPNSSFDCGVVWLYSVNPADFSNDKILSITNTPGTAAYSDFQRLVEGGGSTEEKWTAADFTYSETTLTGLSAAGEAKRATAENRTMLVLPDKTPEGRWITGIQSASPGGRGLFAVEGEEFSGVKLPAQLETIGAYAFQQNNLQNVEFPSTVTTIDSAAFQMNKLTRIVLPDSVTTLGAGVFASNTTLESVTLSSKLKTIPASAFYNNRQNTNFTSLVIPEGVEHIEMRAFGGAGLTDISLPGTLKAIGNNAFSLHLLESLTIPGSVQSIGSAAFNQCTNEGCRTLQTLILGNGVKTIGSNAFQNAGLREVELPRGLEKLSASAFKDNNAVVQLYTYNAAHVSDKTNFPDSAAHTILLKNNAWDMDDFTFNEAVITGLSPAGEAKRAIAENRRLLVLPDKNPAGEWIVALGDSANFTGGLFGTADEKFDEVILPLKLVSIGQHAFREAGLKAVEFPETVESIGMTAFQTNQLSAVHLPNSVTFLGNAAFATNPTLTSVILSENLENIPVTAFGNIGTTRASGLTSLVVPEGVKTIGNNAFAGALLTELSLPGTLKSIGNSAFSMHRLETLALPRYLESIGTSAFIQCTDDGCRTLNKVILNEGLKTIGNTAFRNANIYEAELPASLTKLSKTAFQDNPVNVRLYTTAETHLTDKTNFPDSVYHTIVFDELTGSGWHMDDFTYSGASITGYSAQGEAKRKTLQTLTLPSKTPDGTIITEIADNAFAIPENETTFDRDGYVSPYGMKKVIFPNKLEKIGEKAFAIQNLGELNNLPDTLVSIGGWAFANNKLKSVVLPNSVTNLGVAVFSANILEHVTLSTGLKAIPDGTFSINKNLRGITLHEGITEIGQNAFNGCPLQSLTLPSTLTVVRRGAFYYHQLTDINIPGGVKHIEDSAFECTPKAINMATVTLNEGIEHIGSYAFRHGRLSEVVLPNSLLSLAEDAFMNHVGYNGSNIVRLYTGNRTHFEDKANFPNSAYHTIIYTTEPVNAAAPQITSHPQSQTVAAGQAVSLYVTANSADGGTLTYQWYQSSFNSNTNGQAISGANKATFSASTKTEGTYFYYVVVSNNNPNATGEKTAVSVSSVATITVNAKTDIPVLKAPQEPITDENANITIIFDADFTTLAGVALNDMPLHLDKTNPQLYLLYTQSGTLAGHAEEGSISITLYSDYLKTLPNGLCRLSITCQNENETLQTGTAAFTLQRTGYSAEDFSDKNASSPPSSPQTGDEANISIWVLTLLFSTLCFAAGYKSLLKKSRKKAE